MVLWNCFLYNWSKVFLAGLLIALRGTPASVGWKWVLKTVLTWFFFPLLSTIHLYTHFKISPSILALIAFLYKVSLPHPLDDDSFAAGLAFLGCMFNFPGLRNLWNTVTGRDGDYIFTKNCWERDINLIPPLAEEVFQPHPKVTSLTSVY